MAELKTMIRQFAREIGVDLIGFSSVDRFGDPSSHHHPLKIYPEARSVIGLGFRVLRGAFRGIEEGSTFFQYHTTGVETIEEVVIPRKLLMLTGFIEDYGYEAVPQKKIQTVLENTWDTNPETEDDRIYKGIEIEHQLDFTEAAVCCGLGEIGLSGTILSDEFGPFQRFAFILTDADLAPDPIVKPHLCDQCGLCLEACPGHAFSEKQTFRSCGDQNYPVHERDNWQCAVYYKGANRKTNPFMPSDALEKHPDRDAILKGKKQLSPEEARAVLPELSFYPPPRHALVASICGRACDRACYAHLEEKKRLKRQFAEPFRKNDPWKLDDSSTGEPSNV